ncbi:MULTISPECIES: helix-turn-helix domain-containing protein [Brevibacillus]|uniref:Helix-turn-helix transcriptional regulator n=1 Tax=Brevibacillus laterosporus TaxID=1465 RepID=A0AAP3DI56_BRELA|nr:MULTISPECIES: helix-turn-helix transcriptional regulator [Brevibacillus]MCR8980937.1 helix-turn-helix domain-containing protein [Brevibacillus laterosporus]MCZ0808092.1 helix-turn-helix transcriptional regulator [Brevibacillus laterosporus]MCZ0826284.1 helix-turn-helix transcriptional regulator [Brevibacillus laterosporus]MCZ0850167.1 helix-turn-helix transcriptional regulator [Brevibacillus laterosporus]
MHNLIRAYVKKKGLKFNYVADKAGIERKKFYRLINGQTTLTLEEYERICRLSLEVSPAYFFENKFLETKNETNKKPA